MDRLSGVVVLPGGDQVGQSDWMLSLGRRARVLGDTQEIQRARIIDAFVREVGYRGLAGADVQRVCRRAGVSQTTFYSMFDNRQACGLAALASGSETVCGFGEAAFFCAAGPWETRLHAGVVAMLTLVGSSPGFARLAIVDARHDELGLQQFGKVVARCRQAFGGRSALNPPGADDNAMESVLVGGALGPLADAVNDGRVAHLVELARTVTFSVTLQVVGAERAFRQLERND